MKNLVFNYFILLFIFSSCHKNDIKTPKHDTTEVPHFNIQTENNAPIVSKEIYLNANLSIDGKSLFADYNGEIEIRGRGNNSWAYPQKPYKMKLNSKAELLGLPSSKKWILLANYLDGTLLLNSIPYETGRLLEMPFTNHMIPIEVTINNSYKGFYLLTEDKEVGKNRIDIGDNGVLLELDNYFDEDWKFKSAKYKLPVMIQNPESEDLTEEAFQTIKSDFEKFEALVAAPSFPNNNYKDYFDDTAYINYMIVNHLTANGEINFPKSVYIHKHEDDSVFRMGIIWDFDWGFGYDGKEHFNINTATIPLFWVNSTSPGTLFLSRFMKDPHFKALFKARWNWFKDNKYQDLKNHIENFAKSARQVYAKDHEVWGNRDSSGDFDKDYQKVLKWLDARVAYIDGFVKLM